MQYFTVYIYLLLECVGVNLLNFIGGMIGGLGLGLGCAAGESVELFVSVREIHSEL